MFWLSCIWYCVNCCTWQNARWSQIGFQHSDECNLSLLVLSNISLITEQALCYFDFSQYISHHHWGGIVLFWRCLLQGPTNPSFCCYALAWGPSPGCWQGIPLWVVPGWLAAWNPISAWSADPDFCLICRPWFLPGSVDLDVRLVCQPQFLPGLLAPISAGVCQPQFLPGLSFCLVCQPQFLPGLSTPISARSVSPDFCLGQPAVDSLPARKNKKYTKHNSHPTPNSMPCPVLALTCTTTARNVHGFDQVQYSLSFD